MEDSDVPHIILRENNMRFITYTSSSVSNRENVFQDRLYLKFTSLVLHYYQGDDLLHFNIAVLLVKRMAALQRTMQNEILLNV